MTRLLLSKRGDAFVETTEDEPKTKQGQGQFHVLEPLQLNPSSDLEQQAPVPANNDTFVGEEGAEVQYKTCAWWQTGFLILAENVSLGVLALPQALAILGIVPGLLCMALLGLIATYTGWLIGEFKLAYPHVQSFPDCGELIAGSIGREIMFLASILILVFVSGAHVLTFAVAMNALTDHGACTIIFSFVGMIICFFLGLPRTFMNISTLSIISCASIILAVLVAMIGMGISEPDPGHIVTVRPGVSLLEGLAPVLNIILAYSAHVGFMPFQSEMKDPREFKKALFFEQGIAISFYLIMSAVIYYYAGPLVTSPALGSASSVVTIVGFVLALPTIIISGTVNGSVACKHIYFRMWKGTDIVRQNSIKSVGSWVAVCAGLWIVAWLLAEAIPNFNLLLSLIAALFGSWFSYALPMVLWFYQHRGAWFKSKYMTVWSFVNAVLFSIGVTIFALGMWASGNELRKGTAGKPFSCADSWSPISAIVGNDLR